MSNILLRPAIAMIELIFAIVIMAIVLLSAPQLIQTATESGYIATQQESINEAATRLNIILGYSWDEANTNETFLPTILRTNGAVFLREAGTTGRRTGTPTLSHRSFYRDDGVSIFTTPILTMGSDLNDSDDMDDFNNGTGLTSQEVSSFDYIETNTINITTNVRYGSDAVADGTYVNPGGDNDLMYSPDPDTSSLATSNIKFITVRLTSTSTVTDLAKNITLHAFSANIGGYELDEVVFP